MASWRWRDCSRPWKSKVKFTFYPRFPEAHRLATASPFFLFPGWWGCSFYPRRRGRTVDYAEAATVEHRHAWVGIVDPVHCFQDEAGLAQPSLLLARNWDLESRPNVPASALCGSFIKQLEEGSQLSG